MKALAIDKGSVTRFIDIAEPDCPADHVLIRVERVGLCGSDLNTWRGLNPLTQYPCIPGHEIGGKILQTGSQVKHILEGDRVVVLPCTECGHCSSCLSGRPNACKNNQTLGVQRQGGMVPLLSIPANKVIVCNSLSSDELALVEPLAVGLHAARRAQINVGEWVVVMGCGVIGLGAIAAANAMGGRVVAIDIDDRKQAVAKACGAERYINSARENVAEILAKLNEDRGPAVVIEAIGLDKTIEQAVELAAFCGRVVYVGYAKKPVNYESARFLMKELDIRGSRNATVADFRAVLSLMEKQCYPIELIISAHYPIDTADRAFSDWAADPGAFTKILIDL
ncbi:TPA: zinc-binding alcohol dehydrogenase family protein [Escherichia coli]|uniref:zinc-binding alcohol dehydrogenase family protein n=1 Tax=Escherichia coli TaxID=562 RepID=UPI000B7F4EA9|nr:zinc-binding alcohol dehydrogenase family protein [Escherichia coli]EFB6065890.1 zinc-binding alcohol dehydrogenase family protein [Escherichia coli]EFC6683081.1 zinc-binding alcohol dehydrogenase family protein [Escherichia coli]EFG8128631.1 zinc-binding alcohol dehydrogenase family protein [Escherichia coli]EFJ1802487.1 zinc-binding alcohol dehydrogenase family protein [Escherichia coli]EIV7083165.1 zinc-binding alcohol dehydrogenase family protein [Escherichia coli]